MVTPSPRGGCRRALCRSQILPPQVAGGRAPAPPVDLSVNLDHGTAERIATFAKVKSEDAGKLVSKGAVVAFAVDMLWSRWSGRLKTMTLYRIRHPFRRRWLPRSVKRARQGFSGELVTWGRDLREVPQPRAPAAQGWANPHPQNGLSTMPWRDDARRLPGGEFGCFDPLSATYRGGCARP